MKFKVGDKVKVSYKGAVFIGTIVVIDESCSHSYLIHNQGLKGNDGSLRPGNDHIQDNNNNLWFSESDIEPFIVLLEQIDGEMQDLHMKLHYILKEECRDKSDEYRKNAEKVKELLTETIDELQVLLAYEDSHKEDK